MHKFTAKSRDTALTELEELSPALHQSAIVPDNTPFPPQMKPPTDTPPNPEYQKALIKKMSESVVKGGKSK